MHPTTSTLLLLLLAISGLALAAPGTTLPRQAAACPAATTTTTTYEAVDNKGLPDPWKFANGNPVATADDFLCRQAEMSKMLQQFELGDLPPPPDSLTATMSGSSSMSLTIKVGSNTKTISVSITKPPGSNAAGGPAMIGVGGVSIPVPAALGRITFGNDACAAQSNPASHGSGWFFDLHGKAHSAGATLAWAWCVGRIIDGLEKLGPAKTGIDPARLGVSGCSRNGKGAFMVGAFEKRIALTVPQESGSGGAACWRISDSEKDKGQNIQTARQIVRENAWFSPKFTTYVNKTTSLPADHHFLAALVAPRGLLVLENDIDWLGPVSTTACMKAGRSIYEALGVKGNMGFSLVGGHGHCSFPSSDNANLLSFINRFLVGTGTANEVEQTTAKDAALEMSSWVGGWSAQPKITLPAAA
ncbi:4-O-methyl-glucuronoyl methylesterase [Bombardia bombarda]|uniref:(4-O-methyl)-D-glucuronate--lignin esterase n=1 Tax=Bombardia bombarda TaxID=252184 RepID=A0AA40C1Y2_9PEZI|nr:4-O-methyl-glucuronoyl methylesterase [Bombardia bombarda]